MFKSKFEDIFKLAMESINVNGDLFEYSVANTIDSYFKERNLDFVAVKTSKNTTYSDIEISDLNGKTVCFVEAKFDHKANLYSKRLNVVNGIFVPFKSDNEIGKEICDLMNENPMSQKFLDDLALYLHINKDEVNLYSSVITPEEHNGLKIISRDDLQKFFNKRKEQGLNKYIFIKDDFDVTNTLIRHYTKGKAFPASYLQVDDDFYKLEDNDVIKFNDVPMLSECGGSGYLKIRIGIRSEGYEIIPELKYKTAPNPSDYSFKEGSSKPQPEMK